MGRGVIKYFSATSCPSFLSDSVFRSPRGSTSTPASCEAEEHEKVRLTTETAMGRETASFFPRRLTYRHGGETGNRRENPAVSPITYHFRYVQLLPFFLDDQEIHLGPTCRTKCPSELGNSGHHKSTLLYLDIKLSSNDVGVAPVT